MKKTISLILAALMLIATFSVSAAAYSEAPAERYDLREEHLITSVKNQGNYGTCWAHAICSAAESNLIKNGYADESIDLSELQLVYFTYSLNDDPLGNFTGEGAQITTTALEHGWNIMSLGGDAGNAAYSLMKGVGLVNEKDVPYSSAEEVLKNGLDATYAYSKTVARLTDIKWYSYSDPVSVKRAISENGAVWTSLYDDSLDTETPCYNEATASYYKTEDYGPYIGGAHAVVIAGWDDNYPVSNFLDGKQPENPGAWLIKDSAGTGWGDGGYWWASYESLDFNLSSTKKIAALSFVPAENYDRTYQYDGGIRNTQFGIEADNAYMANVFTSISDEVLTSVSFSMSLYGNKEYSINIFRNPLPDNPGTGTLIYSFSGITQAPGYYTVPLDRAVELTKGNRFSVIIGYSGADANGYMWFDYDKSAPEGYLNFTVSAERGQSFFSQELSSSVNPWEDILDYESYYGKANFRIKAHTVRTTPETLSITSMPYKTTYTDGEKLDLSGLILSYTDKYGESIPVSAYASSLENGTEISVNDNNTVIAITYEGLTVYLPPITVNAADDGNSDASDGFLQRIINFFNKILAFFKSLFS